MTAGLLYEWSAGGLAHSLRMAPVDGTAGNPYSFGAPPRTKPVDLEGFHIATTPTTQALWEHVMGTNPALHRDPLLPLENVSWDDLVRPDVFLDRINRGPIRSALSPLRVICCSGAWDSHALPSYPPATVSGSTCCGTPEGVGGNG